MRRYALYREPILVQYCSKKYACAPKWHQELLQVSSSHTSHHCLVAFHTHKHTHTHTHSHTSMTSGWSIRAVSAEWSQREASVQGRNGRLPIETWRRLSDGGNERCRVFEVMMAGWPSSPQRERGLVLPAAHLVSNAGGPAHWRRRSPQLDIAHGTTVHATATPREPEPSTLKPPRSRPGEPGDSTRTEAPGV